MKAESDGPASSSGLISIEVAQAVAAGKLQTMDDDGDVSRSSEPGRKQPHSFVARETLQ